MVKRCRVDAAAGISIVLTGGVFLCVTIFPSRVGLWNLRRKGIAIGRKSFISKRRLVMIIEWKQELATGNEEIDNQHKEMFKKFNDFQSAYSLGKAQQDIGPIFTFLDDYVKFHFAMEEELQVRHSYPGYKAHKEEHDSFIHNLKKMEKQLDTSGVTSPLVIQANMALVSWLFGHIKGTDREFATFLTNSLPMV
jgi:hemerythrin